MFCDDVPGFYVRLRPEVRNTVVFVGYPDDSDGFTPCGTGFLLAYDGAPYLVTAKHIAHHLGRDPFAVRLNLTNGTSINLHADDVSWYNHPDDTVDVAVLPFHAPFPKGRIAQNFLKADKVLLTHDRSVREKIYLGDLVYTVGLFRLLAGKRRNLPTIHPGIISLLPTDERTPVQDWQNEANTIYVEGYLVEKHGLPGLSGSPVFVRPSIGFGRLVLSSGEKTFAVLAQENVFLLGMWQGSWDAPPDAIMAAEQRHSGSVRIAVGFGVVVPAYKIGELLETEALRAQRAERRRQKEADNAAKPD